MFCFGPFPSSDVSLQVEKIECYQCQQSNDIKKTVGVESSKNDGWHHQNEAESSIKTFMRIYL